MGGKKVNRSYREKRPDEGIVNLDEELSDLPAIHEVNREVSYVSYFRNICLSLGMASLGFFGSAIGTGKILESSLSEGPLYLGVAIGSLIGGIAGFTAASPVSLHFSNYFGDSYERSKKIFVGKVNDFVENTN